MSILALIEDDQDCVPRFHPIVDERDHAVEELMVVVVQESLVDERGPVTGLWAHVSAPRRSESRRKMADSPLRVS